MEHQPHLQGVRLENITALQTVSIIVLAAGAGAIFSIQPVLLAAMMHDGRLTAIQLGRAATTELAGTAIMSALAAVWFKPERLKLVALGAILFSAAANICTMAGSGNEIIAARLLGGCCSGTLLWLLISLLVRSAAPVRLNGFYIASVSFAGFCVATVCEHWLVPRFGGAGAFGCLLGLNVLMIIPALLVPEHFAALPKRPPKSGFTGMRGMAGLVSIGTYTAAILSLWIYIVPISAQMGLSAKTVNLAIQCAIIAQVLGGLCAGVIGRRLSYIAVLAGCILIALFIVAAIGMGVGALPFVIAIAVFGLIWMMALPYQVLFVIAADPSRRAAVFSVGAQLGGCAIGPFLASSFVSRQSVYGALGVSAGLFTFSLVLLCLVHIGIRLNPGSLP